MNIVKQLACTQRFVVFDLEDREMKPNFFEFIQPFAKRPIHIPVNTKSGPIITNKRRPNQVQLAFNDLKKNTKHNYFTAYIKANEIQKYNEAQLLPDQNYPITLIDDSPPEQQE